MLTYSLQRIRIIAQAKEEEKHQRLVKWVKDNVKNVEAMDNQGKKL
jgi:hypothetical protein